LIDFPYVNVKVQGIRSREIAMLVDTGSTRYRNLIFLYYPIGYLIGLSA
jgi:hypothetical protein